MTVHRRNLQTVLTLALAMWLSVTAGCAGISKYPAKKVEAEPTSEERAADVVRDFERKRDDAQYSAAAQCLRKGDLAASQTSLQQLLARSPDHRAARLLLSEVFVCQGQPQMAAMQLETARKHYPNDAEVEHTLGLVRDSMDQHDVALVHYRRAAELAPDNNLFAASVQTAARAPLERMDSAADAQLANALNVALQPAARANEIQQVSYSHASETPPLPSVNRQQPPANLAVELDAAPLPPAHSDIVPEGDVAVHFADVDNLPVGQAMAARQRNLEPTTPLSGADRLTAEGLKAVDARDIRAALDLFRRAMADDPQNPQIPIIAAVALLRRGEASAAVELLSPAAQLFPSSPRVHQTLGLAHYRAGNYQAAQSTLQHALRLDNSHALSYFLMGRALAKLGDREAAARNFEQARALDPKFTLGR